MTNIPLKPKLAIFDLDNTLLNGDSDLNWGHFLADKGIVDAQQYRESNEYYYQQYEAGSLDIHAFLEFALKPLSEHPMAQLLAWRECFMEEYIEPIVLPKAEILINHHKQQKHQLLIITATNRFVTEPIAQRLGIAELLATDPEIVDDRFTGRITGVPCFKEGKVARLQDWLSKKQLEAPEIWFYSDSHNDIPLLSIVDHAIAVDADKQLQEHALTANWKQISLR